MPKRAAVARIAASESLDAMPRRRPRAASRANSGARGAEVELVTPERMVAPEIDGLNHAAYARIFHRRNVRVTVNTRLLALQPGQGNCLFASWPRACCGARPG